MLFRSATYGGDVNPLIQEIIASTEPILAGMLVGSGNMWDISLEGRGNSLVYVFKYLIAVPDKEVSAMIEPLMEQYESLFMSLVYTMEGIGIESPSVIVEYYNMNDTLLYSQEYK